jgi:hypothetical protein
MMGSNFAKAVGGIVLALLLLLSPAGAHISDNVSHLWTEHLKSKVTSSVKSLAFTKQQATGRFLSRVIPPGQTVRGMIGGQADADANGDELAWSASLPGQAPVGLTDDTVTVNGEDEAANECPGSSTNPTAAPGFVCIYTFYTQNADDGIGYIWGDGDGTKWGFQVSVNAGGDGQAAFFANWAYRAPQ